MNTRLITALLLLSGVATATSRLTAAPLVTIETVLISDTNNRPDPVDQVGQVNYFYRIGKYDITAGQYVTFLNAVATKPKVIRNKSISAAVENLWIPAMSSTKAKEYVTPSGVIQRTGGGVATNPYVFSIQRDTNMESLYGADASSNRPMFEISWFRAARFANWMHNGATNGANTEQGAYQLNGALAGVFKKTTNATWWIPSEDEWYKAAYYDPAMVSSNNAGYHDFPTGSDEPNFPVAEAPSAGTNSANYSGALGNGLKLTPAGTYSNSYSYYGAYDMAGPLWQWNDAVYTNAKGMGENRGMRGGSWSLGILTIHRYSPRDYPPNYEDDDAGFRLCREVKVL
jgi:formylglycine-generating enzyme required for sulfatase activity